MNDLYSAATSSAAVQFLLHGGENVPERGMAKKLADSLKCHPTFISQVSLGKGILNNDQAFRFCKFFRLSDDETQYFFDLVHKDRSGTKEAREFFEAKLEKQRDQRMNLKNRFKNTHSLSPEDEGVYYDSWLPQVIHMICQCEGDHTKASLAIVLGISRDLIDQIVNDLDRMGLLGRKEGKIICTKADVHLAKSSPAIRRLHYVWRIKTLEMMGARRELTGLHFSSLVACDEPTLEKLKKLWTRCLEDSRKSILTSKSKKLAVMCLDLYPFFEGKDY